MHKTQGQAGDACRVLMFVVFLLLLPSGFWFCGGTCLWAGDEEGAYPDEAGKEAIRLWTERERDRTVAEAVRRYWDYWLSHPSRQYSGYCRWLDDEETQKWLKDPKHNPPPPPPPPYPWVPPPYPSYPYSYFPYYYPGPYHWDAHVWPLPPYYPYPGAHGKAEDEDR